MIKMERTRERETAGELIVFYGDAQMLLTFSHAMISFRKYNNIPHNKIIHTNKIKYIILKYNYGSFVSTPSKPLSFVNCVRACVRVCVHKYDSNQPFTKT